jgi:hypothetical protein
MVRSSLAGCFRAVFAAALTILVSSSLSAAELKPGGLLAIGGTLVIMVPFNAGLIIAADSRTDPVAGVHCDDQFKISEPRHPDRTVVTITGVATILEKSQSVPLSQICEQIRDAGRILDIQKEVIDYLEGSESETIVALDMKGLIDKCLAATSKAGPLAPINLQSRRGQDLFSVVLATYHSQNRVAAARGFVIGISQQLEPVLVRTFKRSATSEHSQQYWAFGETKYLYDHVIMGAGRQYLSPATIDFRNKQRPVRELTLEKAEALAIDLIQAAARATDVVTPPSGIGGKIDIALLGRDPRPKHLQWKSP